ncbi:DMT family transporter [soil metagenome]
MVPATATAGGCETGAVNLLLALVAVMGASASGPLMAATHAPALAIAFWRNGFGTAALAPIVLTSRRAEILTTTRREWRAACFAGLMLAGHFATWVYALQLTSVAAATALVSTQIVFVVLINRLRGESVARPVVIGTLCAIAGVLVISGVDFALSPKALLGDVLAIAGGLFAALYLVVGGSVRQRMSTTLYTFICYGSCAVILLGAAVIARQDVIHISGRDWLLIVAVTLTAQLLGHSLFNHLLAVMSPTVISLVLLLEVPGAALLAAVFLHQLPGFGIYVGLILILAGLAVVVLTMRPQEDQVAVLD